jgi:Lrp/AsnC family transcriptional regulator for asnA, asnC and gidA
MSLTPAPHPSYPSVAAPGPVAERVELDQVDSRIVEILQRNGRESFRSMARDIGVAEATVRSRYEKLVQAGVLHVTAVTNPLSLGYDAQALVAIRTIHSTQAVSDVIAQWVEAVYVVQVAGQFDLIVEILCADRKHFLDVLNRIRNIDGVVSTESFIYLLMQKQVYDWGIKLGGDSREI